MDTQTSQNVLLEQVVHESWRYFGFKRHAFKCSHCAGLKQGSRVSFHGKNFDVQGCHDPGETTPFYGLDRYVQPQRVAFVSLLVTNCFSALVLNWVGFLEEATFLSLSI